MNYRGSKGCHTNKATEAVPITFQANLPSIASHRLAARRQQPGRKHWTRALEVAVRASGV